MDSPAATSSSSPPASPPDASLHVPGAQPAAPASPEGTASNADTPLSAASVLLGRSDSLHMSGARSRRAPSISSGTSARQRARSRSPAPATTHSLAALHGSLPSPAHPLAATPPAAASPALSATGSTSASSMLSSPGRAGSNAAVSRPAPVVPPSPSVPTTPAYSRPTSPHPPTSTRAKDEPSSPVRNRIDPSDEAHLSQSTSQVDLSHIFERDVEFPTTHHITPSEAVDVAVPPVLTEAAVALSAADDDPIASRDLAALVLDAEQDAQANSGWSSPVAAPAGISTHSWQPPQQHAHPPAAASHATYANASRSPVRGSRSFSPDSSSQGGGRATSPGSSYFSAGTPPTSAGGGSPPPASTSASMQSTAAATFGPFSQRLAEALENEASKLPPGLTGTAAVPASAAGQAQASSPELSPRSDTSSPPRLATHNVLSPSLLRPFSTGTSALSSGSEDPFTASPLSSPSQETSSTLVPPQTVSSSTTPTPATTALVGAAIAPGGVAAPHPRKLSFATYADLVNEERLAELTGERLALDGVAPTASGTQTPGGVGLTGSPGGGAGPGLSRSRSGTQSSLMVDQLESRLAAAAGLGFSSVPVGASKTEATEVAAPAAAPA